MDTKTKISAWVIGLAMAFPVIATWVPGVNLGKLKGDIKKVTAPGWNLKDWFNGDFQKQWEDYFKSEIAIAAPLIRTHNQIQFSLFNNLKAKKVVEGEAGYLYEQAYIDAYLGLDALSQTKVRETVNRMERIRSFLCERGVELIVVMNPGKGRLVPEFIPGEYKSQQPVIGNYHLFKEALEPSPVRSIDYQKWFLEMKDTTRYPLYSKGGIHWSYYGEQLVTDSLVSWFNRDWGREIGRYEWKNLKVGGKPQFRDNDISQALNLMFPWPDLPNLAYPETEWVALENGPRTVVVADSYYWGLFNRGISKQLFSYSEFWFYNKGIYKSIPDEALAGDTIGGYRRVWKKVKALFEGFLKGEVRWSQASKKKDVFNELSFVNEVDYAQRILNTDYLILMNTDPLMDEWGFGLMEDLEEQFLYPERAVERECLIMEIEDGILKNTKWVAKIQTKAQKQGISFEEMLRKDANYLYKQREKKKEK